MAEKMETYAYFIFILLAWGLWGFFGKYALKFISPTSLILWESIGSVIFYLVISVVLFLNYKFETNATGITMSILTAFFGVLGIIIFLHYQRQNYQF